MNKALFITFDNTLIKPLSNNVRYLHSNDWRFVNQTLTAIKDYYDKGYTICFIINQAQIDYGIITQDVFNIKLRNILSIISKDLKIPLEHIHLEVAVNPDSYYFLPEPGMIYKLALKLKLDLKNSILIGSSIFESTIKVNGGLKQYIDITELV
jgi:histidinol phosphatase-like enzyme